MNRKYVRGGVLSSSDLANDDNGPTPENDVILAGVEPDAKQYDKENGMETQSKCNEKRERNGGLDPDRPETWPSMTINRGFESIVFADQKRAIPVQGGEVVFRPEIIVTDEPTVRKDHQVVRFGGHWFARFKNWPEQKITRDERNRRVKEFAGSDSQCEAWDADLTHTWTTWTACPA